jgi:hypothetical protein
MKSIYYKAEKIIYANIAFIILDLIHKISSIFLCLRYFTISLTAFYIDASKSDCIGGFGAPLQFEINGKWFLRGLLDSAFSAKETSLHCPKNHVASFTDTARHVKFITHNANIGLKNAPNVFDVTYKGIKGIVI